MVSSIIFERFRGRRCRSARRRGPVESGEYFGFVAFGHVRGSCFDRPVVRTVVGLRGIIDYVDVTKGLNLGHVFEIFRFQSFDETFGDGSLGDVLRKEMFHSFLFKQLPESSVAEFRAFVRADFVRLPSAFEYLPEGLGHLPRRFRSKGHRSGVFGKNRREPKQICSHR